MEIHVKSLSSREEIRQVLARPQVRTWSIRHDGEAIVILIFDPTPTGGVMYVVLPRQRRKGV